MTDAIHTGDAFDVLPDLPDESMHACVTDPPYGLNFMSRGWDDFEPKEYQKWCEQWAREVKGVLKPGGHMLAFSGNRTHHRLFTGVEDAGFEIRDTLTWHYGSGFPKASDISKTIDKRADAEREVIGENEYHGRESTERDKYGEYAGDKRMDTAPATDAAKQWDGFKTGLKPATEYVVVARKPFDGATVDCVQRHGTGALNIDGTRIDSGERPDRSHDYSSDRQNMHHEYDDTSTLGGKCSATGTTTEGRYPSNVVFDETEAERLDREVGELGESSSETRKNGSHSNVYGDKIDANAGGSYGYEGSGGPSRYFYTSKATKAERTLDGKIGNAHPTVKPADLMEWLVKLVTAEGQTVLDPFTGSGTTCRAAKDLGRRFVGIEKQAKWADVARVRAGLTPDDPSVVREDGITGLDAFADD
jgi:site-specific DNA-methyltransferase (adenine-specific)